MFLLGVILRLQKSCCLYSEKRMGGWGGVAGGGWLALPKQLCEAFRLLWSHMCTENYRIRNSYNNTAFDTKLNNQILYGDKTAFWHQAAPFS